MIAELPRCLPVIIIAVAGRIRKFPVSLSVQSSRLQQFLILLLPVLIACPDLSISPGPAFRKSHRSPLEIRNLLQSGSPCFPLSGISSPSFANRQRLMRVLVVNEQPSGEAIYSYQVGFLIRSPRDACLAHMGPYPFAPLDC